MDDDPLLDSAELDAATTDVASDRQDSERHGAVDPVGGGDVLPHEGGGATSSDSEADTRQKASRVSKRQPPRSPSILLDKEPPPPVMSDVIPGVHHPGFAAFTGSLRPSHVHHPQAHKVHGAVPDPHRDHCRHHQERQLQDCPLFQPSSSAFSSQASLSQTTDDDWATAPTSPSKEGAIGFAPHDAWPHTCGDGHLDGPWQQNMEDRRDSRWTRMSSSSLSSGVSSSSTACTSCPSSCTSPLVHLTTDTTASTTTAHVPAQFGSACDSCFHFNHPHQSGLGHGRATEEQEHWHHHKQQQRRDGEAMQQGDVYPAARASQEGEEEQTRILQHWSYRLAMRQHVQRQFSRLPALFSMRVCSHIPPLRPTPRQPSSRTASDPAKTSVSSLPLPSQPRGPSPSPKSTAGSHRQRSKRANATRRRRRRR